MEAKYIHPVLQEAFSKASPAIQIETDLTFDIALRINEILIRKNWTQADLAKATGKTDALVSTWLSGKHNFTIRTLAVIEAALGEGIISVKKYKKPSDMVEGYRVSSRKAAFLNEAETKYGNNKK